MLFEFTSIAGYLQDLRGERVSCEETVQFYLDRIETTRQLNAFVRVYAAEALDRARALDKSRRSGIPMRRLHGVVIGLKDVLCLEDHPVTAASRMLESFISPYTATAVQRLIDEEAIIIGHCNCDEFAMGSSNENSVFGRVRNAIDPDRVAGGSSGGSAVAVQAGLCMASLGSDTGGSVRQPADFCGILGLKPTYGRISRYGLIAYASSFDQIGLFGTDPGDLALLLEIMAGADGMDSTASGSVVPAYGSEMKKHNPGFRIAVLKEALDHPSLDPEIRDRCRELSVELREAGHTVEEIGFDLMDYVVPAYYVLTTAEASSNLSRFDGVRYGYRTKDARAAYPEFYRKTRSEGFGREVQRRILLGTFVLSAGFYDSYFTRAQQVRKMLVDRTELIFNEFDIILTPTVPGTAFKAGENSADPVAMYLADLYTVYANLTGIPGLSLPLFTHSNGMPFGIQAMTNRFRELYLFQLASQLIQKFKSHEIPV